MLKKIAVTLVTLIMVVGLSTACSSDDKKDSKGSDNGVKSSSVSVSDFEDDYEDACDSLEDDVISEVRDINFENITADEFEEKFELALDEYKSFSDKLDDIEVPSKYEDDWDEFKDSGDDQEELLYELKPYLLQLLDILDQIKTTDQTDVAALQELQDQAEALNDEMQDTIDKGDKLEKKQDELRDNMNIEDCLSN
jgi:hypothetical protein